MAGYLENKRFQSLLNGVESSGMRLSTNLDAIYEKYNRPFEDDDLISLSSLTIFKDNGYLRKKKPAFFGSTKLKCTKKRESVSFNQAKQAKCNLDLNVSMAIARECATYLNAQNSRQEEPSDAETLSSDSSDESDENDATELSSEEGSLFEGAYEDDENSFQSNEIVSDASAQAEMETETKSQKKAIKKYATPISHGRGDARQANKVQNNSKSAVENRTSPLGITPPPHKDRNHERILKQNKFFETDSIEQEQILPLVEQAGGLHASDTHVKNYAFTPRKASSNNHNGPLISDNRLNVSLTNSLHDLTLVSISSPELKRFSTPKKFDGKRTSSPAHEMSFSSVTQADASITSTFRDLTVISVTSQMSKASTFNKPNTVNKPSSVPPRRVATSVFPKQSCRISIPSTNTFVVSSTADRDKHKQTLNNADRVFKSPLNVKARRITPIAITNEHSLSANCFQGFSINKIAAPSKYINSLSQKNPRCITNTSQPELSPNLTNKYESSQEAEFLESSTTANSFVSEIPQLIGPGFRNPSKHLSMQVGVHTEQPSHQINEEKNGYPPKFILDDVSFTSTETDINEGVESYDFILSSPENTKKSDIKKTNHERWTLNTDSNEATNTTFSIRGKHLSYATALDSKGDLKASQFMSQNAFNSSQKASACYTKLSDKYHPKFKEQIISATSRLSELDHFNPVISSTLLDFRGPHCYNLNSMRGISSAMSRSSPSSTESGYHCPDEKYSSLQSKTSCIISNGRTVNSSGRPSNRPTFLGSGSSHENNCTQTSVRTLLCSASSQTSDLNITRDSYLLQNSVSTQTMGSREVSRSVSCWKGASRDFIRLINHKESKEELSKFGFDQSKWKNLANENTQRDSPAKRGMKRKDSSTSDYFTDSLQSPFHGNLNSTNEQTLSRGETEPKKSSSTSVKNSCPTSQSSSHQSCYCHCSNRSPSSKTQAVETSMTDYQKPAENVAGTFIVPQQMTPSKPLAAQHEQEIVFSVNNLETSFRLRKPIKVDINKLRERLARKKMISVHDETNSGSSHFTHTNSPMDTTFSFQSKVCTILPTPQYSSHLQIKPYSSKSHGLKDVGIQADSDYLGTAPQYSLATLSPPTASLYSHSCVQNGRTPPHFGPGHSSEKIKPYSSKSHGLKDVGIQADSDYLGTTPQYSLATVSPPTTSLYGHTSVQKGNKTSHNGPGHFSKSKAQFQVMFPPSYIEQFCPNNPLRIDSDSMAPDSGGIRDMIREQLKAFRPRRNAQCPRDHLTSQLQSPVNQLQNKSRETEHPTFVIDRQSQPTKYRKISSYSNRVKDNLFIEETVGELSCSRLKPSDNVHVCFFSRDGLVNRPFRSSTPLEGLHRVPAFPADDTLSTIIPISREIPDEDSSLDQSIASNHSSSSEDGTLSQTVTLRYNSSEDDIDLL